jgi:branched-chain amino acid transport system substrate-binding protein
MRKYHVVLVLIVSLGMFLNVPEVAAQVKTLKIGKIAALTGAGASWGTPIVKTAQLYWDLVNQKGGLEVGGERYKVELIIYDDKYSIGEAKSIAEKLIFRDKVKYITGPMGTPTTSVVAPYCDENKVIMIGEAAGTPLNQHSFHGIRGSAQTCMSICMVIAEKFPNWKKFACLGPDDATGWKQTADDIQFINEICKGQVVALEFWTRGTKDFYPLITKLRAAKPDVVLTNGTATAEQAILMKQAAELGWKTNWANHGMYDVNIMLGLAPKEAIEGAISNAMIHEPPEAPKEILDWKEKYIARYGQFDETSIMWYTPKIFMETTFRRAKSIAVEDFLASSESLGKFKTLIGDAYLGGKARRGWNHGVCEPITICQIRDGKLSVLAKVPAIDPPAFKLYPPAKLEGT